MFNNAQGRGFDIKKNPCLNDVQEKGSLLYIDTVENPCLMVLKVKVDFLLIGKVSLI